MSKILFLGNIYVIPNTFSRVALLQLLVILFELARLHEDDVVDGRKVHSCALNLIFMIASPMLMMSMSLI